MNLFKFLLTVSIVLFLNGCSLNDSYSAKDVFTDPQVVALAKATKNGDLKTIDALLGNGLDIDTTGKDNLTPLYWSFLYVKPSPEVKSGFKHLLQKGANPMHIHEPSKLPLLHMVSRGDDPYYLQEILGQAKDLDLNYIADDWVSPTALANAVSARRFKNFKLLIEAGASIGKTSSGDESILEKSSGSGTWNYALYLLEQGADYTVGNEKTTWNPDGYPEIVRSLELMQYWDHLYPNPNGQPSDRDKVITFLKEKGVEVYPYHREDDPRYNPRPQAYVIDAPNPHFDYQALLDSQTQEIINKYNTNYLAAKKFLIRLKRENAQTDDFETFSKKVEIVPNQDLMKFFYGYAVDVFDANSKTTTRYRKDEILKQLENHRGEFRDHLVQLSYFYSQPYPQYSETNFVVTEDETQLFIRIAANYGLFFTNEEEPKLKKIEYYNNTDHTILHDFEKEINLIWDYCYQLDQTKDETLELEIFNDVNLYRDISPDNYSLESNSVFGLAMINLKNYQTNNHTKVITAEFYGRDQDKYSHYFFNDDHLQCVLTVQEVYDRFKTQEESQIESTIINTYLTYKDLCYKRDESSKFQRLSSDACETIRTDSQTYKEYIEKN